MTIYLFINLCNFLFLLIVFYLAQGTFYPEGSVIAKIALLLILLISSFYLIKSLAIKSKKVFFYYAWLLLLLLNFFGYILGGVFRDSFSGIYFSQIKAVFIAILPFFPIYYFAYKGSLSKNQLLRFFIILIPIAIASFYSSKSELISESLSNSENVVINTSYFFVALISYTFLWSKNKAFSIVSLIVLIFFIIQGAKRGALITGVAGALIFCYYQIITINPKRRFLGFITAITGIILVTIFIYDFYINNEFLIERIERIDEGGSNRDVIYLSLLKNWFESDNLLNYLFGFGFVSTTKYSTTGHLAHNDWLELLTNFGLLGVFIYLLTFCSAIRFTLNSKVRTEYRLIMFNITLMWFLQTLFSMYYTSHLTMLGSVLMGYIMGSHHYNKKLMNKLE